MGTNPDKRKFGPIDASEDEAPQGRQSAAGLMYKYASPDINASQIPQLYYIVMQLLEQCIERMVLSNYKFTEEKYNCLPSTFK